MWFEETFVRGVADCELFDVGRCCGAGEKEGAAFRFGKANGARRRGSTASRGEFCLGSFCVRCCRCAPFPTVACDEGKFACTHVQFAGSSRTGLSVEREAEEFFGIGRINEVSRRLRETKHVSRLRRLFFDILRTQGFHPGLGCMPRLRRWCSPHRALLQFVASLVTDPHSSAMLGLTMLVASSK
jgi:hypothetical protein